jgi:hypothetical protein
MKLPGLPEPAALPATLPADDGPSERILEPELVATLPRRDRVTGAELATIAHLVTRGLSVPEIADVIGRAPSTVRANVRHARDLLKALAPEAVELWLEAARVAASKGNHAPARDMVYAAGAAQAAPQHQQGPSMVVNVGIALPGIPVPARTDETPED